MDQWFTFVAQIVNFLILIVLMKKFLYGPIISAMDEREARIAERMKQADAAIERAEREERTHRELTDELKKDRETMMHEAAEEAEQHRRQLMEQARADVEAAENNWRAAIEREKTVFLRQLRELAGRETVEIARKTLRELADSDLEERVIRRFIERIGSVEEAHWAQLAQYGADSEQGIGIYTAFPLRPELSEELVRLVRQKTGSDVLIAFERDQALLTGIELRSAGVKIAWSMDDHIDSLQQSLSELVERELVS